MLGLGLTLMGGLLAQDNADWTQMVMYYPSGELNAAPGGDESSSTVSLRYATKLWEAVDANDDDSVLVHTLSRYDSKRYCFIMGPVANIQYYRYSVNFATDVYGKANQYLEAGPGGQGSLSHYVSLGGHTDIVFRLSCFREMQTYTEGALLSEMTDTALTHHSARNKIAKIGQAASTFGGAYYHNRTAGREQERCVFAMSSAQVGSDYRGAIFYVQGKELTEL